MTAFNEMMLADAANVFCQEFAETITYRPVQDVPFEVSAVVDRNPPDKASTTPRLLKDTIHVHFPKNKLATRPILSGDKIQLCDSDVAYTVTTIMDESDAGMWHLAAVL